VNCKQKRKNGFFSPCNSSIIGNAEGQNETGWLPAGSGSARPGLSDNDHNEEDVMYSVRHILEVKGKDVWSVRPNTSVLDALRLMADKDIGALLVMDESDHLLGIISERDYARKVVLKGKNSQETLVKEIMTEKVITIHADQTVEEAMNTMLTRRVRHLPVVVDDRILGVVSVRDVMRDIIFSQREKIRTSEGAKTPPLNP